MIPKGPYSKASETSAQPLYTKESGISSGSPLPLGSCVLNAINTSKNSSVVVGILRFNFVNHSWLIKENVFTYFPSPGQTDHWLICGMVYELPSGYVINDTTEGSLARISVRLGICSKYSFTGSNAPAAE